MCFKSIRTASPTASFRNLPRVSTERAFAPASSARSGPNVSTSRRRKSVSFEPPRVHSAWSGARSRRTRRTGVNWLLSSWIFSRKKASRPIASSYPTSVTGPARTGCCPSPSGVHGSTSITWRLPTTRRWRFALITSCPVEGGFRRTDHAEQRHFQDQSADLLRWLRLSECDHEFLPSPQSSRPYGRPDHHDDRQESEQSLRVRSGLTRSIGVRRSYGRRLWRGVGVRPARCEDDHQRCGTSDAVGRYSDGLRSSQSHDRSRGRVCEDG